MQALQYFFVAIPFAVMMGVALFSCIFTVLAFKSPVSALWLIGFCLVFEVAFPNLPLFRLGLLIYVPDLVCLQLGFVTLVRMLFAKDCLAQHWYYRIFVATVFLSFGLGAVAFGSAAGAGFRPEFYSVVVASYFMSFRTDESQVLKVFSAIAWMCAAIVVLVVTRWIIVSVPIVDLLPPGGSYDPMREASILRVVGAEVALVIGQIFVVLLFYPFLSRKTIGSWFLVLPFAVVVIGLQHRSVWLAVIAALMLRYALPAAGRRGSTQILVLLLVLFLAAVPVIVGDGLGWVAQDVAKSADRALSMTDTAQARVNSWQFGIDKWRSGGLKTWLLGQPIGTSMERFELTSTNALIRANFQIHNNYINMLLHYGAIGLGSILCFFCVIGWRLYRLASSHSHAVAAPALLLVLAMQLTFFITYGIHFMQGLFLGLAAAYVMTADVRSARHSGVKNKPSRHYRNYSLRNLAPVRSKIP